MFKKKPQIKQAAPLRSSDRRKLADSVIQEFGLLPALSEAATDEQRTNASVAKTTLRNSLFPENVQTAKFTTTHGPELRKVSGIVYTGTYHADDVRILWWQIDGRIFPSVYTIWRHPDIVALLSTPGIVIQKMQGGADLMTPGLAGGPPFPERATKDSVVVISSIEQPTVPVVVGLCEIDVSALRKVQGAKGVAAQSMHWAGDELYNYSPTGRPPPDLPDHVDGWERAISGALQDLALDDEEDGGVVISPEGNDIEVPAAATLHGESVEPLALAQKDIDHMFRQAFLFGVYHHKTSHPKDSRFGLVFPLNQSIIMSSLIQPFLPAHTDELAQQLHIKKTSWKNIKKFVKSLDKEGIVKSKETGGNEVVILDIDFTDAAVLNFKPYKLPKKESAAAPVKDEQNGGLDDSIGQKLEVKTLYKPSAQLSPLFLTSDKQFFSPAEVKEHVTSYIASEKLISEQNKRMVKLNPALANAVFDGTGALDNEVIAKGSVPREALIERILTAMTPMHKIVRNSGDIASAKARAGAAPKIHITLESLRGGSKIATKVSGLEVYHVRPRLLAEELRKTCASSTSVEALAGATKKNEAPIEEIMIQGPQHEAVIKALEKRGILRKWIDLIDKSKGPKRWKGATPT